MELKGKALYNLLKINTLDNPQLSAKAWQIEDLRPLATQTLFERLKQLKLPLDENSFHLYAEESESPEELLDYVWVSEHNVEARDRVYLILFELWRRLLPEKQCLSIFCDELDHLIDTYDRGNLDDKQLLENALCILEDVLDDACDSQDASSQEVFEEISRYCAHDLETFLYDYISEQIETGDELYASELIDSFYEYIADKKWFDFLRARLFFSTHSEESNHVIERLLEQLKEEPDVDLLLQVIESLVHYGDIRLFQLAVKQTLPLLTIEQELRELLTMCVKYFRCLDKEKEEKTIQALLDKRAQLDPQRSLDAADKNLYAFYEQL